MVNRTTRSVRALLPMIALALTCLAAGCDKKGEKDEKAADDSGAQVDAAVVAMAEVVEKHFAEHGTLPETGYLVYCRGGRSVIEEDELYAKKLGYVLPGDIQKIDLCLNVDGKKAGIHARKSPMDETGRCLFVDVTSGKPVRSEITDAASCAP